MRFGAYTVLAGLSTLVTVPCGAAGLRPHEAVYDLSLASQSNDIVDVNARIALQLKSDDCDAFKLDYRFVARFHEDNEITVTDQQTLSTESRGGQHFEFETKTLIDGAEQETVKGTAQNEAAGTRVSFRQPVTRDVDLPLSTFPLHHTSQLIEKAIAGERIVETKLFDGDNQPDKHLTTTAVLTPAKSDEISTSDPQIRGQIAGLRSWHVTESYFNSDSDRDGLPIFETRYRLYENGVSDELYMNFGAYALEGKLGRLQFLGDQDCTATPR